MHRSFVPEPAHNVRSWREKGPTLGGTHTHTFFVSLKPSGCRWLKCVFVPSPVEACARGRGVFVGDSDRTFCHIHKHTHTHQNHRRSRYLELVSAMLALMHEEMDHPLRKLMRKIRGSNRAKVRRGLSVCLVGADMCGCSHVISHFHTLAVFHAPLFPIAPHNPTH